MSIEALRAEKESFHRRAVDMMGFIMSPGFAKKSPAMQDALKRQLDAMDQYEKALGDRIALMGVSG